MRQPPSNFRSAYDQGVYGILVNLISPPSDPWQEAYRVARFFESTWGSIDEMDYDQFILTAQKVAAGEGLPNALESVALTFEFEGISRATTHQLVRTRVGAGFGQQGGRDNNWSGFNFRIPRTVMEALGSRGITDHIQGITTHIQEANDIYEELLAAGVPYQDARYFLPMGLETALVATYNLLSLKGTLQRRLCNRMMWETNYVARRMHDLVVLALPWVGKSLRSSCEIRGVCQSVSPMFPPSCWTKSGDGDAKLCADHPVLAKEMDGSDYDWDKTANGCYLDFDQIDSRRVKTEPYDEVWSLVDGLSLLTRKDNEGKWMRV